MVYLSYNFQDLVDVHRESILIYDVLCSRILQVTRADYLSGRTALHFATVNGHVRCMRLVLSDFVPSALFEPQNAQTVSDGSDGSNSKTRYIMRFLCFSSSTVTFILAITCQNGNGNGN